MCVVCCVCVTRLMCDVSVMCVCDTCDVGCLKCHVSYVCVCHVCVCVCDTCVTCDVGRARHLRPMGSLRLVGSFKLQVSFAKEPYKKDDILPKRPIIVATAYVIWQTGDVWHTRHRTQKRPIKDKRDL